MSSIFRHCGNQNHTELSLTTYRAAISKKQKQHVSQGCREWKWVQTLWKSAWIFFKKLKMHSSAIPGHAPKGISHHRNLNVHHTDRDTITIVIPLSTDTCLSECHVYTSVYNEASSTIKSEIMCDGKNKHTRERMEYGEARFSWK